MQTHKYRCVPLNEIMEHNGIFSWTEEHHTHHLAMDQPKSSPPPQRDACIPWAKLEQEACGGSGGPPEPASRGFLMNSSTRCVQETLELINLCIDFPGWPLAWNRHFPFPSLLQLGHHEESKATKTMSFWRTMPALNPSSASVSVTDKLNGFSCGQMSILSD